MSTGTPPGSYRSGQYPPPPDGYPPAGGSQPPGGYPPPGYRPARSRASRYGSQLPGRRPPARAGWFKRFGPWIALILATLMTGVFAYVLYTLRDVPDPAQIPVLSHSIVVYDRKGREIEQRNSRGEYYQTLKLGQMGHLNQWATLAAEDREFYNHPAIDFVRTASAAASDILHQGNLQGGSTITQQLVKISVLTPQRSVFRKMQEATIAFGLESKYSKDTILEMYLNRVYYGHNAYGIGAATKVYFGADKEAKDVTPAQAAFLAALINGPSYYDPQTNFDGAKARQLYVLNGMVKTGKLTQAEADQAAQEDIKAELKFDRARATLLQSKAPHFANYVIGRVEQALGGQPVQGGLKIYTTLDLDLQSLAQQSVANGVSRLKGTGVNNGDLLAANPATGEILAWVGSADYYNDSIAGQVDVIQSNTRQPGSSFKPYVYAAALRDHKITLASTLQDQPTDFGGGYRPLDYDNQFLGDISARRALLLSRNVPAVQVGQMEGMDRVLQQAHSQGIQSTLTPNLATAIGASAVSMFDNLQGYQVFANQGTLMPLMTITRVTDAQDNDLIQQIKPGTQSGISHPLTAAESYLITDTLKDYQNQWHLGWKRQMAGKSGTTGGTAVGVHPDAWMMAYNPDIVVGAWAGNTAPNGGGKAVSAFGTDVGSRVLANFINGLPSNMSDWYKRPDGIVTGSGCPGSSGGTEIFLPGTESGVACPTPSPTPTPTPVPTSTPTPPRSTPSIVPSPGPSPRGLPPTSPGA